VPFGFDDLVVTRLRPRLPRLAHTQRGYETEVTSS
jgi:hypothetical protein